MLIDLKTNRVTHQDIGQMDMYVRMYDELKKAKDDLGENSNLIARKSGTEPVIKLRVEGKDVLLVERISKDLKNLISKYQK